LAEDEKTKLLKLEDIPGVGPATASKLREAGYITVESVAVSSARSLSEATGLSTDKAAQVAEGARSILKISFMRADEVLAKRMTVTKLTTGSENLDELLGGGIETQAITELIGEYGAGKTQICHKLSALVQLPEDEGGLNGKALYIDAEGTFRPERIDQIAKALGMDEVETLKRIVYARSYSSDHQTLIVEEAFKIVPTENIKLLVIDSIISHFRSEFIGRETLATRQQKLNYHLHTLLRLAEAYNLAVVVTNQVIAAPDVFFGPAERPAGGHIIAHTATHRIFIRKGKGNIRIARIIDSPYLPESETIFMISEKGIEDPPKEEG